jgi:hypothetical protein
LANVCELQAAGLKVVIADNYAGKRKEERLSKSERKALRKAQRTQQSKWGRGLMRMRGQHIERTFAHILDCGGIRKATLRGGVNLQKRYNFAAACYNLSQLLRKKLGCGTLKMAWRLTGVSLLPAGGAFLNPGLFFSIFLAILTSLTPLLRSPCFWNRRVLTLLVCKFGIRRI